MSHKNTDSDISLSSNQQQCESSLRPLFYLNRGEKRPNDHKAGFPQSLRQRVFDGFPVGSGEVGLELEQGRNMLLTAGEIQTGGVRERFTVALAARRDEESDLT